MPTAYINIGSNIGDRATLIERAVAAIELALHAGCRRSAIFESEPWGFDSRNRFLNLGIAVDTTLNPQMLLATLQSIERDISPSPHRNSDGSYADRAIDIDLIAVDSLTCDSPALTLPHPRMHMREFVLQPLCELNPDWEHPILHQTAARMLEELRGPH